MRERFVPSSGRGHLLRPGLRAHAGPVSGGVGASTSGTSLAGAIFGRRRLPVRRGTLGHPWGNAAGPRRTGWRSRPAWRPATTAATSRTRAPRSSPAPPSRAPSWRPPWRRGATSASSTTPSTSSTRCQVTTEERGTMENGIRDFPRAWRAGIEATGDLLVPAPAGRGRGRAADGVPGPSGLTAMIEHVEPERATAATGTCGSSHCSARRTPGDPRRG